MAVKSFKRYKGRYVDPEKPHLIEEVERLKEVNARLTKRNQELAEKVAQLRGQSTTNTSTTSSYTSNTTYY
jgi:hypothetical protein